MLKYAVEREKRRISRGIAERRRGEHNTAFVLIRRFWVSAEAILAAGFIVSTGAQPQDPCNSVGDAWLKTRRVGCSITLQHGQARIRWMRARKTNTVSRENLRANPERLRKKDGERRGTGCAALKHNWWTRQKRLKLMENEWKDSRRRLYTARTKRVSLHVCEVSIKGQRKPIQLPWMRWAKPQVETKGGAGGSGRSGSASNRGDVFAGRILVRRDRRI